MINTKKADFGLWLKTNQITAAQYFYNFGITDICRIGPDWYSLFVTIERGGIEYALSLDFHLELLPKLLSKLHPHFSIEQLNDFIMRLTDDCKTTGIIEWKSPIFGINCHAVLGTEIHTNNNERYLPLIVKDFS